IFPHGAFEPADKSVAEAAAAIPEWLSNVVPTASGTAPWAIYRWSGGSSVPAFRSSREPSARPVASPARLDLWINGDGTAEGSLSLNVSGRRPPSIEFQWPETARPTGLFIGGEFRPLPSPANGACAVSLPEAMTDRMVWLSWIESGGALPAISGPLSAHVPWPREIPVENLRVSVHAPRDYRVELAPPRSSATADTGRNLVLSVRASKIGKDAPRSGAVSAMAAPEPGMPFTPGASIKLVNQRIADIGQALAVALISVLLCWRIIPAWRWLIENETA